MSGSATLLRRCFICLLFAMSWALLAPCSACAQPNAVFAAAGSGSEASQVVIESDAEQTHRSGHPRQGFSIDTSTGPQISAEEKNPSGDDPVVTGGAGVPDIDTDTSLYDFGDATVNKKSRTVEIVVYNRGDDLLMVTSISIIGADASLFSIESGGAPFTVAAGAFHIIEMIFRPSSPGIKTAELRLNSNDPDENPYSVDLVGRGVLPPRPDIAVDSLVFDFGDVIIGTDSIHYFKVVNLGTAELRVSLVQLVGTDSVFFAILSDTLSFNLAPADSHKVRVRFSPTESRSYSACLRFLNNDPDENPLAIALGGTGIPLPNSDIEVEPNSHDYGPVMVGTSSTHSFVVRNSGGVDLSVTALQFTGVDSAFFSCLSGNSGFSLAPGETAAVAVEFSPTEVRSYSAALLLLSNDPDENPFAVALTGTGVPVPQPDLAIEPRWCDFGEVIVGTVSTSDFVVRNLGEVDLQVTALQLGGADSAFFSVLIDSIGFGLLPGGQTTFSVRFIPTEVRPYSAVLRLLSNDPDENPFQVILTGNGIPVPQPDIAVQPGLHEYGNVMIGSASIQSFVVSNVGTAVLQVIGTTLSGPDADQFTITSRVVSFTLAPGGAQIVDVRFNPTAVGEKNAILRLLSNDPDERLLSVSLSGNGVEVPVPDIAVDSLVLQWDDVLVGSVSVKSLVVHNAGTSDLLVTEMMVIGVDSALFSINAGKAPFALPMGEAHTIELAFHPIAVGEKNAVLRMLSNDTDESPLDIALTGTGNQPVTEIRLLTPNGGEAYRCFSDLTISWQGTNLHDRIRIELSRNNGLTWETLAEGVENHGEGGEWIWNVTCPGSEECLARVTDIASGVFDTSDFIFMILMSNGTEPEIASAPTDYALQQNYPNPFNPLTHIAFALPKQGETKIEIFDVRGKSIKTLFHSVCAAGHHVLPWDGTDERGMRVSSGIYFYRLQSGSFVQLRKMILAK